MPVYIYIFPTLCFSLLHTPTPHSFIFLFLVSFCVGWDSRHMPRNTQNWKIPISYRIIDFSFRFHVPHTIIPGFVETCEILQKLPTASISVPTHFATAAIRASSLRPLNSYLVVRKPIVVLLLQMYAQMCVCAGRRKEGGSRHKSLSTWWIHLWIHLKKISNLSLKWGNWKGVSTMGLCTRRMIP